MKKTAFASMLIGCVSLLAAVPVLAGTVIQCPDISQARQVGECPTEAEVKSMFKTTCGWERDPQAKKPDKCDTYAAFKALKYRSMWESSDGEFMGYVSCATPAAEIQAGKPREIAVSQKNGLYKIVCSYQGGAALTMRIRSVCKIPDAKPTKYNVIKANCETNPSACRVECE
jgi:hypothetical protein